MVRTAGDEGDDRASRAGSRWSRGLRLIAGTALVLVIGVTAFVIVAAAGVPT